MKTEKQPIYVAPAVNLRRVTLEADIVAPMSISAMSAEADGWDEGSSPITLGDATSEGGDMYLPWQ